jgi:hypothetical protein
LTSVAARPRRRRRRSFWCDDQLAATPALEAHRHETAIIPSVAGWARLTGLNTIFVDTRDPKRAAFTCSEQP